MTPITVGAITGVTSTVAIVLTVHTALNLMLLRRPQIEAATPSEWVSILLPLRNEAHRVTDTLTSLRRALDHCPSLKAELVILDDESTDSTWDLVRTWSADDRRVHLHRGAPRPAGWLGKPWACQQLADLADPRSTVLLFLDADVVIQPYTVAATVDLLRRNGLDLVSPYPRQLASGASGRLIQPLLQWSWLTLVPLLLAERSARPSLAVANGQLLAVDRRIYRQVNGHHAVRADVLDDLALLRAVKKIGGRGGVADGTPLATCRMYDSWVDLRAGYTKSLWTAFGGPAEGIAVAGLLALIYGWPAAAALTGSPVGAAGYCAAVLGRWMTGRRTGSRVWPDALTHPVSIMVFGWLTVCSVVARRRGTLQWKGRPVS